MTQQKNWAGSKEMQIPALRVWWLLLDNRPSHLAFETLISFPSVKITFATSSLKVFMGIK